MNEEIFMDPGRASVLTEAVQNIHPALKLCGKPGNSLLYVSDDLLSYIWSLLKNGSPLAPEASIDQWSDLLSTLMLHRLLPLLYWRIGSLTPEFRPPESITDQMRMAFLGSRVRSLHMERQFREIQNTFQDEGVRTLVLRGPALAWSVYPDPAMRPSFDLDLLVLPEQMIQARAILGRLDYKCVGKWFEAARHFYHEESFFHQKNPRDNCPIDLHWELHAFFESGRDIGVKDLFLRALKVESAVSTFESLHPVDALISAAIHLAMNHNRAIRLIWIYDIALLAHCLGVPDDWELLQERSMAWGARLALENSLKMAQAWIGLRLPDGFNDFSNWPRPTEDELAAWSNAIGHASLAVLFKRYMSNSSGLSEKVRSLFRLLFPHPDIVGSNYPPSRDWLLPLCYVRRWSRWFMQLMVNLFSSSKKQG